MQFPCDGYIKQVQQIYLETWGNNIFEFTPLQKDDLEFIACLEAVENGPGVYQARALLGILGNCDGNGNIRSFSSAGQNQNSLTRNHNIYPNPNNGSFYLEYNSENNATVFFYDLTGKLVHQTKINYGIQSIHLQLISGIYIYKIRDDLNNEEHGKISVK